MDQLPRIGGYTYAIIFHKVDTDFLWFVPLRTLFFEESNCHFLLFCKPFSPTKKSTLVYCDQYPTLKPMVKHFGCALRHPPPGQPRHNLVIERKVGLSLQRASCCLATVGFPSVFCPMVGNGMNQRQNPVFPAFNVQMALRFAVN